MDLQLANKIIVVTGGSSGIGAAICDELAAEGAVPVSIDLRAGKYETYIADLREQEGCEVAIQKIRAAYGRIDGLVNNAGLNDGVSLENGNEQLFLNSLQNNVLHYEWLIRFCLLDLKERQGAIVNIISKVAFTGQGGTSGYAAANGMRVGLTEYFAEQLGPAGIRVNGVVVAECDTPAYQKWLDGKPPGEIMRQIPLENRLTSSKEVAGTVAFLLSPLTPTNGQLIFVDGGYVYLDRRAGHE